MSLRQKERSAARDAVKRPCRTRHDTVNGGSSRGAEQTFLRKLSPEKAPQPAKAAMNLQRFTARLEAALSKRVMKIELEKVAPTPASRSS